MDEKNSKNVDIKQKWDHALSVLRAELGEATFRSWFRHIEFGEFIQDDLILYVPTKFMKDWIHTHYGDRILSILKNNSTPVKNIIIDLKKFKKLDDDFGEKSHQSNASSAPAKIQIDEIGDHNTMLGAPLDPNLSLITLWWVLQMNLHMLLQSVSQKLIRFPSTLFFYTGVLV